MIIYRFIGSKVMSWIKTEQRLWFSRAKEQRDTCKGPPRSRRELSSPKALKEARFGSCRMTCQGLGSYLEQCRKV